MSGPRLVLNEPQPFLAWLAEGCKRGFLSFSDVPVAQVFAVAAVAALARYDARDSTIYLAPDSAEDAAAAARFAHAIGIDEVTHGDTEREPTEHDRTVSLTRVRAAKAPEAVAERIAGKIVDLLIPGSPRSGAADLFWFVLVELLRNVGQHSQDPAGGIVAAQRNDAGPYAHSPALQIVVVDNGVGIHEALRRQRPQIQTPSDALVRALEPHVSGTFPEGLSGSVHNAGLGLFFISEIAKQTNGRLLLASRGATYFLDRTSDSTSQPVITNGASPDYPGTLVVCEMPLHIPARYDQIIKNILELAAARTPQRITYRWLRFEPAPAGAFHALIAIATEDTAAAHAFAASVLEPRILARQAICLDFANVRVSTQSFLHALLHEVVRLAWARKVPIHVVRAAPAVRAQIEFVESYSLGG